MAMSSIFCKSLSCCFNNHSTNKQPSTRPCLGSPYRSVFPTTNHGCLYLTSHKSDQRRKGMAINCNGQPIPSPIPSSPPPSSGPGKGWIVGIVLTVILPFLQMGKWGPLMFYKGKVDAVLQKVEDTAELLENVAEKVDKEAEELVVKLPDGKLKQAVGFIEHAAEQTAKTAHLLDATIDKVQEMEDKVEEYVESRHSTTGKTSDQGN